MSYYLVEVSDSFRSAAHRYADGHGRYAHYTEHATGVRSHVVDALEAAVVAEMLRGTPWPVIETQIPAGLNRGVDTYEAMLHQFRRGMMAAVGSSAAHPPEGLEDPAARAIKLDRWLIGADKDYTLVGADEKRSQPVSLGLIPRPSNVMSRNIGIYALGARLSTHRELPAGVDHKRAFDALLRRKEELPSNDPGRLNMDPATVLAAAEMLNALQSLADVSFRAAMDRGFAKVCSKVRTTLRNDCKLAAMATLAFDVAEKAAKLKVDLPDNVSNAVSALHTVLYRTPLAEAGHTKHLCYVSDGRASQIPGMRAAISDDPIQSLGDLELARLLISVEARKGSDLARAAVATIHDDELAPGELVAKVAAIYEVAEELIVRCVVADSPRDRSRYDDEHPMDRSSALWDDIAEHVHHDEDATRAKERFEPHITQFKTDVVLAWLQQVDPGIGGPEVPPALLKPTETAHQLDEWCTQTTDRSIDVVDALPGQRRHLASFGLRAAQLQLPQQPQLPTATPTGRPNLGLV